MKTDIHTVNIIETGPGIEPDRFAHDVLTGLSAPKKHLSSKYFYDEAGSRIFEEIMKLPEYYLTNCEWDIFRQYKQDILDVMQGGSFELVDLGAGDGLKTRVLLEHFTAQKADFEYAPIDINKDILVELCEKLAAELPGLETVPVSAEYFDALQWLGKNRNRRKLVLFMGSNIGNFSKKAAAEFLTEMQASLSNGDMLLIGVDLVKDPRRILRAYDDSQGVTASFNINLLKRINNELGGDFNLDQWSHYANYNPVSGAVKSYLISQAKQEVYIAALNRTFMFEKAEAIHTEYSYKYTMKELEEMAASAGFIPVKNFMCGDAEFVDAVWEVRK